MGILVCFSKLISCGCYLIKMALWRPFIDVEMDIVKGSVKDNYIAETSEFINKDLHPQTQRLIFNIYTYLKSEMRGASQNEILKRIFELIKLPCITIYTVVRAGGVIDHSVKRKRDNQKLKKVDNADKEVIRRVEHKFLRRK
ncbi:unnamed protein product [Psylliodes chrysocephalus]|uniref:Uncharacterized protein n=1 Tax=Psylliodes chrysocephalus TaxID=3402493 RepID=A0A9P0GHE5_9CUCU|nr:unnamed protein product [Psylliodes chrysocephala]